jgi:hypothetical protein
MLESVTHCERELKCSVARNGLFDFAAYGKSTPAIRRDPEDKRN